MNERIETKQKINDNLVACIDTIFNEQFGNFKALAESSTANTDFSSLPDGWTIENAVHSFDISIGKHLQEVSQNGLPVIKRIMFGFQ